MPPVINAPAAPTLSVNGALKQLRFSWVAVVDATHYRLLEKRTSASSYAQVGGNLPANSTRFDLDIAVHRFDWVGARYIVQACNAGGCSDSAPIDAISAMLPAIGYVKATANIAEQHFGVAVALSGDGNTLAIGAPNQDAGPLGRNAGVVFVYARSANGWAAIGGPLTGSNTRGGDNFGSALALSDNGRTLAVGAWGEDGASTTDPTDLTAMDAGAVYIFTYDGAGWSADAYVKPANPKAGTHFGAAISLSGDGRRLAVGAPVEDSAATGIDQNAVDDCGTPTPANCAERSGAVFVYGLGAGGWTQQTYVKASNTGAFDEFGRAVALSRDGATLAVGAWREESAANTINGNQADNSALQAGAAYVFRENAGTWSQQAYLKPSNTDAHDHFGGSIAISADGNTVAVGAPDEDAAGTAIDANTVDDCGAGLPTNCATDSGAVYVYAFASGSWTQQTYVKATNTGANDGFGSALALSADGSLLAVGGFGDDSVATGINGDSGNGATNAGAVYLYARTGSVWTAGHYVKASRSGSEDEFGIAVALSNDGDTLVIGAHGEDSAAVGIGGDQTDDSVSAAGAVYLY